MSGEGVRRGEPPPEPLGSIAPAVTHWPNGPLLVCPHDSVPRPLQPSPGRPELFPCLFTHATTSHLTASPKHRNPFSSVVSAYHRHAASPRCLSEELSVKSLSTFVNHQSLNNRERLLLSAQLRGQGALETAPGNPGLMLPQVYPASSQAGGTEWYRRVVTRGPSPHGP